MRFTPSARPFPNRSVWNSPSVGLSRPFKEDRRLFPLSRLLSSKLLMVRCRWLCARRYGQWAKRLWWVSSHKQTHYFLASYMWYVTCSSIFSRERDNLLTTLSVKNTLLQSIFGRRCGKKWVTQTIDDIVSAAHKVGVGWLFRRGRKPQNRLPVSPSYLNV